MKTLICIDGNPNALKATKLAAKFACDKNSEAVFLFVRRYRKRTRGYDLRSKATEIFAEWDENLPEIKHLHDAETVFKKSRQCKTIETEMGENHRTLVHLGKGVFEEGKVRLRSESSIRIKIREGSPPEEIIREVTEGSYELVVLGARRSGECRWYDVEHIPLTVAEKISCSAIVASKEFEEGQPLLVVVGARPLPESASRIIHRIASKMKSNIDLLTVGRKYKSTPQFPGHVSAMVDTWSAASLKVRHKVLTGEPIDLVRQIGSDYGLVICPASDKPMRKKLDKLPKKILCDQLNLLVLR
ncbi:MAG: universal stress protein [Desulfobacterales bacterium]|nr:universal stress protein [Desulfobacterales bacterium]